MQDVLVDEVDMVKSSTESFTLIPSAWEEFVDTFGFKWEIVPLDKSRASHVPTEPGVYTLLIQPGLASHPACSYLMYVGKSETSLRTRFLNYAGPERKSGRPRFMVILAKYAKYLHFCYSPLARNDVTKAEAELMNAFRPPMNKEWPAKVRKVMEAFKT